MLLVLAPSSPPLLQILMVFFQPFTICLLSIKTKQNTPNKQQGNVQPKLTLVSLGSLPRRPRGGPCKPGKDSVTLNQVTDVIPRQGPLPTWKQQEKLQLLFRGGRGPFGSPTCPSPPNSPLSPPVPTSAPHIPVTPLLSPGTTPRRLPHVSHPGWPPLMAPGRCQAVAAHFQALLVPGEGECEERGPVHPARSCPATRRLRIDPAWPGPHQHQGAAGCGNPPSCLPVADNEPKNIGKPKKWKPKKMEPKKPERGFCNAKRVPRLVEGTQGVSCIKLV